MHFKQADYNYNYMQTTTKRVIDYKMKFAPDGTVYRQTVTITNREFDSLLDARSAEVTNSSKPDDYVYNLFIKQPLQVTNNKACLVFTNLTQRDFFNKLLKAKLLDRNTCLKIKN